MATTYQLGLPRRHVLIMGAGLASVAVVGGFGFLAACEPPPPGTNPARNPLKLPQSLAADGAVITAAQGSVDLGGGRMATALTYDYTFPVVQRAGLSFYHPHPHLLTGKQVALGLAGAIVVHDAEEDALPLPNVFHQVPLILRDAMFDRDGNLAYKPQSAGFFGDLPLVNGTIDASLGVDTALYRLRVLNGSNARILRLAFSDDRPFTLIGNDGGLLVDPVELTEALAAPAERFDLLVDLSDLPLVGTLLVQDRNAGWDLLELEVTREVEDATTVPVGPLSTIEPLGELEVTREFSFDGMGKINGLSYDMARIDVTVPFGETERWVFTTGGNAPHPVHVHGVPFQVQSRTGGRGRLEPWEAGWKDTVCWRTARRSRCSSTSTCTGASTSSTATSWSTRTTA